MKWNVAAPFFNRNGAHWIDDFVPGDRHSFRKIGVHGGDTVPSWHRRAGRGTPLTGWLPHWRAAGKALKGAEGIITVFPQLAATTAIRRTLAGKRDMPIVAWCFNLGLLTAGARRTAARLALRDVERFIVHSTAEIQTVAEYLAIDQARVQFVPLQRAAIPLEASEEEGEPFIVAMGSANRDYGTLIEAARRTGLPVVIVAAPRAMAGLDVPANVTVQAGLTNHQCHLLAQRARISVVPLADVGAASGQVTVIEAQRMHRPVIATRSIGTVDYIEQERTGLLVEHDDAAAMACAMQRLWDDSALRRRLVEGGAAFAAEHLSDEAAGAALKRILDDVAATGG